MKTITDTFITIADDSGASMSRIPERKGDKSSVARVHYEILAEHPYEFDINAFNFEVFCRRNGIAHEDRAAHRDAFFSKSHPCMRTSPLTKTHGFGAHYNGAGKIAIYPVDSKAYSKLASDPANQVEMAMRSKRPEKAGSAKAAGAHPRGRPHGLHTGA